MTVFATNADRSYHFDVRQFHQMLAAGIFEDQKVELIAGKIYAMTDLPPHTFAVETYHEALRGMLPRDRWTIREEKPVLIGRYWAPKPDLSILRGHNTKYAARQPRPRDVALLVEISDTTYRRDRGRKWRRYAAAGIPGYMIVHLQGPDTVIEVWTNPTGRGRAARYADVIRYNARAAESVPIELDGSLYGKVAVLDLVAPQP
jgi:Uma2 family endonuclease